MVAGPFWAALGTTHELVTGAGHHSACTYAPACKDVRMDQDHTPHLSETVTLTGHLLDNGTLGRVLDEIRSYDAHFYIDEFNVGAETEDESSAKVTVTADDEQALQRVLMRLQSFGANPVSHGEVVLQAAEGDWQFPEDFYSTTNLETFVFLDGRWVHAHNSEMDCALLVTGEPGQRSVRTIAMSDVKRGDLLVCGTSGVKVQAVPASREKAGAVFEFMNSDVSSEKPQALLVSQIAQQMREVKALGQKILWVGGPAIVHTGAAGAMAKLINAGYVDVLFAGNALATHDIEAALFGTSLGIDLAKGSGVEHGHEHHIRAINTVRRAGSIAEAVGQGLISTGVMHAMVTNDKPFVLVGSVRDDGPLPEVYTDVIEGQNAMRAQLPDVGFAIMVATMLHSVGTGNMLPARIPLVCVDINPATVTKLADRGSAQARGIVTDIGLFLEHLARELVG